MFLLNVSCLAAVSILLCTDSALPRSDDIGLHFGARYVSQTGETVGEKLDIPKDCSDVPKLLATQTSSDEVALGQAEVKYGDEIPAPVADKIREYGLRLWQHFYPILLEESKEDAVRLGMALPKCEIRAADVFENIYRSGYNGTIDLFVAHLYGRFSYEEVRLVLFDRATQRVTESPPEIFSKWRMMAKDNSLRGQFLRFEDIDRDGRKEIGALEYTHNGNVYNGQVVHYFTVDDGLNLRESLALEVETRTPHIRIQRSTQWVSANSLNLIVRTYNEYDGSGKLIDKKSYRLSRRNRSEPYQLVGKFEKQDPPWIVSGCEGTSANDFLAHGCEFRY